jgi:hypothetical protein
MKDFFKFEMKYIHLKRILLLAGAFAFMACAFTSCEMDSCKVCKQVTYVNGAYDHEGNPNEYCGASLIAVEATNDVINGNTRIAWECN